MKIIDVKEVVYFKKSNLFLQDSTTPHRVIGIEERKGKPKRVILANGKKVSSGELTDTICGECKNCKYHTKNKKEK